MNTKISGIRAAIDKAVHSIAAVGRFTMVEEKRKSGRLRYVAVNLNEGTQLELHIKIDGQDILTHTPQEVAAGANICLGITAAYGAGGMLQVHTYATGNYGIILDLTSNPIEFEKELLIEVKNRHAATAYSTQATYALYEID
jgi:hypothetical protein